MALLMPVSIYAGVTELGERNAPASLAAGRAAAYDAGTYRLASGDMIRIQVFGEDDLSLEVRLDSSGVINYPFLGKIRVKGLTVEALRNPAGSHCTGRRLYQVCHPRPFQPGA